MIKLYLSLSYIQHRELKEHLWRNGYHVQWDGEDVLEVDADEIGYVITILEDRGIGYCEE